MKKEDYEKILAHCQAGLPNESCGLLAGDIDGEVKSITEVYLLTNIDASNEHFSMDLKAFGIDPDKNVTIHEIEYL